MCSRRASRIVHCNTVILHCNSSVTVCVTVEQAVLYTEIRTCSDSSVTVKQVVLYTVIFTCSGSYVNSRTSSIVHCDTQM